MLVVSLSFYCARTNSTDKAPRSDNELNFSTKAYLLIGANRHLMQSFHNNQASLTDVGNFKLWTVIT